MLLLALRRLGVAAESALYVGDMVIDVQTARAANVAVWAVPTGSEAEGALSAAGPDRLLRDFSELPGSLRRRNEPALAPGPDSGPCFSLTLRPPSRYREGSNSYGVPLRPGAARSSCRRCIVPRLIVIKGADEGKQFELRRAGLRVGRDATNRIRLHDTEVSPPPRRVPPRTTGSYRPRRRRQRQRHLRQQPAGQARSPLAARRPDPASARRILVFSAGRGEPAAAASDLADQHQPDQPARTLELSSAIIKTIGETEGSRILAQPDQAGTALAARPRLANLGVMYEASQAVSHILDLDQLLDRILELIFRSIAGRPRLHHAPQPGQRPSSSPRPSAGATGGQPAGEDRRQPDDHGLRAPREAGRAGLRRRPRRALQHRPEHRPLRHPRGHLRADEGPARDARRAVPRHASARRRPGRAAGRGRPASSPRTTWRWPSPSPTRRPWRSRRRATTRRWSRPSGWRPSARPSPPCRTTSRTSCRGSQRQRHPQDGPEGQGRRAAAAGLEASSRRTRARSTTWSWTCSATPRSASRPSRRPT